MSSTKGEKVFCAICYIILFLFACMCLYPLIYVTSASLSNVGAVMRGEVWLLPKGINFGAYKKVMENTSIWMGYANSIYLTIMSTIVSLIFCTCAAYPLSKKRLIGRSFFSMMIAFTMWFGGGLIPAYLNYVDLNLLNTHFALIIGSACNVMFIIIMRTFFQSIPESLEEAALLDGANSFQVLINVYIPLSKACYATIALMQMINSWNSYLWPMILIRDDAKIPLQVVLKKIILDTTFGVGTQAGPQAGDVIQDYSADMIVYAVILVSTIPMLIAYPIVQKYFKQGMMIGAVKG